MPPIDSIRMLSLLNLWSAYKRVCVQVSLTFTYFPSSTPKPLNILNWDIVINMPATSLAYGVSLPTS